MLSACQISREVILSTHTTCIESLNCHSQRKIRLDPKIDTLLVLHGWNLPENKTELDDSQSLAPFSEIHRVAWGSRDPISEDMFRIGNWVSIRKQFPKLEIFFVIYNVDEQILECCQQGCDIIFTEDRDLLLRCATRYATDFEANECLVQTKLQNAKESLGVEDGDGTSEEKLIDVKCVTIVQPGAF